MSQATRWFSLSPANNRRHGESLAALKVGADDTPQRGAAIDRMI
jgi:hypothetical protein